MVELLTNICNLYFIDISGTKAKVKDGRDYLAGLHVACVQRARLFYAGSNSYSLRGPPQNTEGGSGALKQLAARQSS